MIIELPFLPVSVNKAFYSDFRTRTRHKSKPYKEFISSCAPYLPKQQFKCEIELEINLYFDTKHKRDVDNYIKTTLDMLVYYEVIRDDSDIQRLVVERYYQKGKPETVIEIKEKINEIP